MEISLISSEEGNTNTIDYGSAPLLKQPLAERNQCLQSVPVFSVLVLPFGILNVSFASDGKPYIFSLAVALIVWLCSAYMNRGRGAAWFLHILIGLFVIRCGIMAGVVIKCLHLPVISLYSLKGLQLCGALGLAPTQGRDDAVRFLYVFVHSTSLW